MVITNWKIIKSGEIPRLHGNGFIQLDIQEEDERYRMNIWSPVVSKYAQKVSTQIHSHSFGFLSAVIWGQFRHICFDLVADNINGSYHKYEPQVREGEDTILVKSDNLVYNVTPIMDCVMAKGSVYSFEPVFLHETRHNNTFTVTLMKKIKKTNVTPIVMVLKNEEPDNEFNRYQSDDVLNILWEEVGKVFQLIPCIDTEQLFKNIEL